MVESDRFYAANIVRCPSISEWTVCIAFMADHGVAAKDAMIEGVEANDFLGLWGWGSRGQKGCGVCGGVHVGHSTVRFRSRNARSKLLARPLAAPATIETVGR